MQNQKLKAILIDIITPDTTPEEAQSRMEELENLTNTFGGVVVVKAMQKRGMPDYDTYIGKGKLDEIIEIGKAKCVEVIIVNNILKPRQSYAIEERLEKSGMKIWDRIDLILKIFDKHAKTSEAKLQIELAGIEHMGPRIFGMGLDLMRQEGRVGVRSGQGESNIEIMKRHLRTRKQNILKKLEDYEKIRKLHRDRRKRQNLKTAAIVGYTNAGKSSLLNAMTNKGAYVADQLFATLSTRVGKLYIQPKNEEEGKYTHGQEILISDTIGFIQDLPPSLIQAFKSTLAETIEADMILHVIDVTDPHIHKKIEVVEDILNQIGVGDSPKIYVFNKIDLSVRNLPEEPDANEYRGIVKAAKMAPKNLGWEEKERVEREKTKEIKTPKDPLHEIKAKYLHHRPVFVSAMEKANLDELTQVISKFL
ncbi:GTPase HflX [Candidatus Peregrinibacteria bacterium CG_4_10_14_0_2_um_filter_38_24]|nr:MAG: GTPase HflX [Candidatus Peregrinibacteria bacterium CG_4_10_14_0_2_um_filter_38_24]PJC39360.1 MAG: GTPase HflX [Candidatus Peregrinibacteria bacterium CG_4_9_14_0_2_um_filter_38_9]